MKRLLYIITICTTALCIYSCANNDAHSPSAEQRREVDSLIRICKDTTDVKTLITKFRAEENLLGESRALMRYGVKLRESSRFMEAIDAHRKGIELAEKIADTLSIVQNINNIGTNFRRLGILDEAATYHYMAYKYCQAYSDTSYEARKNRVVSLNGIGNVQSSLGNIEAADSAFRLALIGERDLRSPLGQAINYSNIGTLFFKKMQIDSARAYFQKSLDYNYKAKSDLGIALCHIHFGQLYVKEQKWENAKEEYERAYVLMKNKYDEWHMLSASLGLCRVNIEMGDNAEAKKYAETALDIAKNIHSNGHLAEAYELYYKIYEKEGNLRKALDCHILSQHYSDSVHSAEATTHAQNVRVRYERELSKANLEMMRLNLEKTQKTKLATIVAAVAIALLLIAVCIILHFYYKIHLTRLREYNADLLEKYRQLQEQGLATDNEISSEDQSFLSSFVKTVGIQLDEAEPTDIETISDKLSISSRTLTRKLARIVNESPSIYINRIKISKAKNIINQNPDLPIADIAYKCGFDDPNYFSRTFKQCAGISPSEYRRKFQA